LLHLMANMSGNMDKSKIVMPGHYQFFLFFSGNLTSKFEKWIWNHFYISY